MNQTSPDQIKQSRYWVIVPAAGVGARMNAQIPKQYLSLGGKTILEQTLIRLLACEMVAGVVVAIAPDDQRWSELPISRDAKIHRVDGGAERADSVLQGLKYLHDKIDAQDFVLVHDAARPCIKPDQIQHLSAVLQHDSVGGILAMPASDTIKQVDSQHNIVGTLDRQFIWQAQTPQMFRFKILLDCLSRALEEKKLITDEASAVEIYGYSSKVVEGSRDNIKVTRPEDLKLAEFIFTQQKI